MFANNQHNTEGEERARCPGERGVKGDRRGRRAGRGWRGKTDIKQRKKENNKKWIKV